MKKVSASYLRRIGEALAGKKELKEAVNFIEDTINTFYTRMHHAEETNAELVTIAMSSEKAARVDSDADLVTISQWLEKNGLKPKVIQLEDGFGFVFDTKNDAIMFLLRWTGE